MKNVQKGKKPNRSKAVAYLRVSTNSQVNGVGFERQKAAIDTYAEKAMIVVLSTYSDTASGVGKDSLKKRPGLTAALSEARALGIPILVDDWDRIARDSAVVDSIISGSGPEIISVSREVSRSPASIAAAAKSAEVVAKRISKTTKDGLVKAKLAGKKLGNPKNLDLAQIKGASANRARSDKKAQEIADFFGSIESLDKLNASEVADVLNSEGILTSRKSNWTTPAVRRPLAKAKEILSTKSLSRLSDDQYPEDPLWGSF